MNESWADGMTREVRTEWVCSGCHRFFRTESDAANHWRAEHERKRTCCDSSIDSYHRDNCELPDVLRARDFGQPDHGTADDERTL